ncbi:MAG: DUF3060 domain-containing protein [Pyrinomonadaceae bacterium]
MNILLLIFFVSCSAILSACDVRSEIAKKNMEKYVSSPTPPVSPPPPAGTPIDPADIVEVDVNQEGKTITIDGDRQNKTVACPKFDRVMVNGDDNRVTVSGACGQIMINGDTNQITADASMEIVLNGSANLVKYSRLLNGRPPTVADNKDGNVIEKISREAMATDRLPRKIVK